MHRRNAPALLRAVDSILTGYADRIRTHAPRLRRGADVTLTRPETRAEPPATDYRIRPHTNATPPVRSLRADHPRLGTGGVAHDARRLLARLLDDMADSVAPPPQMWLERRVNRPAGGDLPPGFDDDDD